MGLVAWIVVGAIAGFLANLVMGCSEGLLKMIILGVIGAPRRRVRRNESQARRGGRHQHREHRDRHDRRNRGRLPGESRHGATWEPYPRLRGLSRLGQYRLESPEKDRPIVGRSFPLFAI